MPDTVRIWLMLAMVSVAACFDCDADSPTRCSCREVCGSTYDCAGFTDIYCVKCPVGCTLSGDWCRVVAGYYQCNEVGLSGCEHGCACRAVSNSDGGVTCSGPNDSRVGKCRPWFKHIRGGSREHDSCEACRDRCVGTGDGEFRPCTGGTSDDSYCACDVGSYRSDPVSPARCDYCTYCTPGQWVRQRCTADENAICEACPPNTYSFGVNADSCQACKEHETLVGDPGSAASCVCDGGYWKSDSTCQACPVDTYAAYTDVNAEDDPSWSTPLSAVCTEGARFRGAGVDKAACRELCAGDEGCGAFYGRFSDDVPTCWTCESCWRDTCSSLAPSPFYELQWHLSKHCQLEDHYIATADVVLIVDTVTYDECRQTCANHTRCTLFSFAKRGECRLADEVHAEVIYDSVGANTEQRYCGSNLAARGSLTTSSGDAAGMTVDSQTSTCLFVNSTDGEAWWRTEWDSPYRIDRVVVTSGTAAIEHEVWLGAPGAADRVLCGVTQTEEGELGEVGCALAEARVVEVRLAASAGSVLGLCEVRVFGHHVGDCAGLAEGTACTTMGPQPQAGICHQQYCVPPLPLVPNTFALEVVPDSITPCKVDAKFKGPPGVESTHALVPSGGTWSRNVTEHFSFAVAFEVAEIVFEATECTPELVHSVYLSPYGADSRPLALGRTLSTLTPQYSAAFLGDAVFSITENIRCGTDYLRYWIDGTPASIIYAEEVDTCKANCNADPRCLGFEISAALGLCGKYYRSIEFDARSSYNCAIKHAYPCVECPPGSTTLTQDAQANVTSCVCLPGLTGPDGGPCEECPVNTFKPLAGSGVCTPCGPFSHTTERTGRIDGCECWNGRNTSGSCNPCSGQAFCERDGPDCLLTGGGSLTCEAAAPGFMVVDGAVTACDERCVFCYGPTHHECTSCANSTFEEDGSCYWMPASFSVVSPTSGTLGSPFQPAITVEILNGRGQTIVDHPHDVSLSMTGVQLLNGMYTQSTDTATGNAPFNNTVPTSTGVGFFVANISNLTQTHPVAVSIQPLGCPAGEFEDRENFICNSCPRGQVAPSKESLSCTPCSSVGDKYSADNRIDCLDCRPGAFCRDGVEYADAGYWGPMDGVYLECQYADSYACPGGDVLTQVQTRCGPAHEGPICGHCAPGHAKQGAKCGKCREGWKDVLIIIAVLIAVVAFVAFSVHSTKAAKPADVVVKVLLNYVQVLGMLSSMSVHANSYFKDAVGWVSVAQGPSPNSFPARCLFSVNLHGAFGLTVAMQAFAILVICVYAAAYSRISAQGFMEVLLPALIVWLFTFYASVETILLEVFTCRSDVNALHHDASVPCPTAAYYVVAIAAAIITVGWSLGIPAFFYVGVKGTSEGALRGRKLDILGSRDEWVFLSNGYRGEVSWFETITMLRKTALVAISAIVASPLVQILMSAIVLFAATLTHSNTQPFIISKINRIEMAGLTLLTLTIIISAMFIDAKKDEGLVVSLSVLLVLSNCVFFIFILAIVVVEKLPKKLSAMIPEALFELLNVSEGSSVDDKDADGEAELDGVCTAPNGEVHASI